MFWDNLVLLSESHVDSLRNLISTTQSFCSCQNVLFQMFKCRQGTSVHALRRYANNIDHQHETTNNKSPLRLPLAKTETAKCHFIFKDHPAFKELPRDIRSIKSIVLFKSRVKEHFLS